MNESAFPSADPTVSAPSCPRMGAIVPSLAGWTMAVAFALALTPVSAWGAEPVEIDFHQQIRPILSQHCFACHGPNKQEGDLRLDQRASATSALPSGQTAIIVGDVAKSELLVRIAHSDADLVMPPPATNKPLSEDQKTLLRQWIAAGAPFAEHWAFVPPTRPSLPAVKNPAAVKNEIDPFILARLDKAGLKPSPTADKRTLLRRVTLDLIGLPPTPAEIAAFLADDTGNAYERAVDRLLESPRFGEQMARYWLDVVRYGDTHGLHLDNYREMWPYRDWVIRAFNDNKPFDVFVTEQMAGDLLPRAGLDQMVASGFNRLNITTSEGGSIAEEVYVRNVVDRVDAFGTIFMGMTVGCAVCHDHKYDPISMGDYYSLFAFFNSLEGSPLDGNSKDHPPNIRVPNAETQERLARLAAELATAEAALREPLAAVDAAQQAWEQQILAADGKTPEVAEPIYAPLVTESASSSGGAELKRLDDHSLLASGANPARDVYEIVAPVPAAPAAGWRAFRLEVLTDDSLPDKRAGRSPNGNAVLSEFEAEYAAAGSDQWQPLPLANAWADHEQPGGKFQVSYAIDKKQAEDEGWAIEGHAERVNRSALFFAEQPIPAAAAKVRVRLRFESQWGQHAFGRVRLQLSDAHRPPETEPALTVGDWYATGPFPIYNVDRAYPQRFASEGRAFKADEKFRYMDKDYTWTAQPALYDGTAHPLPVVPNEPAVMVLHRTLDSPTGGKAVLLVGSDDGVKLYVNNKQVLERKGIRTLRRDEHVVEVTLNKGKNDILLKVVNHGGDSGFYFGLRSRRVAPPAAYIALARKPAADRSPSEQEQLRDYYRSAVSDHPDLTARRTKVAAVEQQIRQAEESIPITLVYQELETPKPAYILERGQYESRGPEVPRATPKFLPPLPSNAPLDRLGLAQWLLSPEHPLTARVAVNRFWQQFFGTGLVKTSEDFGSQGEPPSHPLLLDWLAVDFRESGWDVKRLVKQLVMSATYQQSSRVTPELLQKDPNNRLLARSPRYRLDAEMVRDQALYVSGLLTGPIGGPSVKPPQPAGIWEAVGYSDSNTARFTPDTGDKIYRRSLYTFWKRTAPPPTMSAFDAPSRESCTVRRERTNTPMQALVLLNEEQFVESARRLAERVLTEVGTSPEARIDRMFEICTARVPTAHERTTLASFWAKQQAAFAAAPASAEQFLAVGQTKPRKDLPPAELAAAALVAQVLLNLDEVVMKN